MFMFKLNAFMAAGAAVVLAAGGTAAGAAIAAAGPVRDGVIHGCYSNRAFHGAHRLTLQNVGTRCSRGTTAISWNKKGQPGPAGPAGPTGPAGPAGPAGPGLVYTTASGLNGPTISTSGTYFIDLTVTPENLSTTAIAAVCSVQVPSSVGPVTALFVSTYAMPAGSSADFTLTGMGTIAAGVTPTVACANGASGQQLTVLGAKWWVAPVQTSG